MNKKKAVLILFDIDGTLIDSGGAGRRSLDKSFFELTGIRNGTKGIIPDGKTDPLIIVEMFRRRLHRDPTQEELKKMEDLYLKFLRKEVYLSRGYRVLPGVYELLEKLKEKKSFMLGLGTGNFEEGARIKLSRANLNRFFSFGGFGSDSIDRVEVLRVGIERGKRLLGERGMGVKTVLVVGDTPYDIKAAKEVGARMIALASGNYSEEDLRREAPDLVISSLQEVKRFLEGIKKIVDD